MTVVEVGGRRRGSRGGLFSPLPSSASGHASPPAFVAGMRSFGAAPALTDGRRSLTYTELDDTVAEAAERLAGPRRLVGLVPGRTVDDVVFYLAALRAGLPVVLIPRCRPDAVLSRYRPDVVVEGGAVVHDVRPQRDRDLHPDLAVLLSTSGSTGSPRLVRLSHGNVESNASAIAVSLGLRGSDRAVTTLDLTYSYGLSVLHSHLHVGAGVVLNDLSVTDARFAGVVRDHEVTTLAAVPYTFELLDRCGDEVLRAPSLRQVTCAGGKLPAGTARRYADLGARLGWELVLMYGATEATARMAVLPGHLTASRPGTAGRVIPGGSFRIDGPDAEGVGDLVYTGPNVMLGYADSPADLARGREVRELVTGDRARLSADGFVEIAGRCDQVAKVHGLRVDLGDVDVELANAGLDAACVALDGAVGVGVVGMPADVARAVVCSATGLPPASVVAAALHSLPRLDNGKLDRRSVAAAVVAQAGADPAERAPSRPSAEHLRRRYEALLGVPVSADQSFADAGGDSLAYVAVSVAVEDSLGHLPRDWHCRSIDDLVRSSDGRAAAAGAHSLTPEVDAAPRGRRTRHMETSVVLRAVAIAIVVASHVGVIDVRGGAHLLMAIVGFNLARFQIGIHDPALRWRRMMRTTAEILVPALVLMVVLTWTPEYEWYLLGATSWVLPGQEGNEWRYWFVEALLWLLPLLALALSIPAVESLRARAPWGVPATATILAWLAFQAWVPHTRPAMLFAPFAVIWLALLGWAVAEARTPGRRAATSVLVLATVLPVYDETRLWVIPAGLLALLWVPSVRLPARAVPMVAALAGASLYVYLTHWVVLDVVSTGWLAVAVCLGVGVATHRGVTAARGLLRCRRVESLVTADERRPRRARRAATMAA